jgi:hypothetical protein
MCYFFLKRSKNEISENLRFLVRILGYRAASLICPVESKPKRRMTRRQKIGVMFMASRSLTENHQSEGGEQNAEQRGCDSKPKRKVPTRILGRSIRPHSNLCVVLGMDRHALQTQFPPSGIELRNGPQFPVPSSHSVSTMAAATNPIATPIKGLSTANQKETFQPESLVLRFLFMLFSEGFADRHFRKRELCLCDGYGRESVRPALAPRGS